LPATARRRSFSSRCRPCAEILAPVDAAAADRAAVVAAVAAAAGMRTRRRRVGRPRGSDAEA
jgi:hypothetical protein